MTIDALRPRRDERLGLRLSEAEKALLHEAAALAHTTVSAFVLDSARERAEALIAERRRIVLDDDTFDAFVAALDAPPEDNPRLRDLFRGPSPFASP
jgi:uncharacterized protein (DUF1778 family)